MVMSKEHRWQGVGTLSRLHDNGLTCAVKWDSGRLDRSIKLSDLIIKKAAGSSGGASPITGNSTASPTKSTTSNSGNSEVAGSGSPLGKPQLEKTSSSPGKPEARKENGSTADSGAGATARKPEPQAEATQPENVAADAAKQNQDVEAAAPPPPHADPGRPILWATVGALGGMAVGVLAGALWLHREAAAEHVRLLRLQLAEAMKPADPISSPMLIR